MPTDLKELQVNDWFYIVIDKRYADEQPDKYDAWRFIPLKVDRKSRYIDSLFHENLVSLDQDLRQQMIDIFEDPILNGGCWSIDLRSKSIEVQRID